MLKKNNKPNQRNNTYGLQSRLALDNHHQILIERITGVRVSEEMESKLREKRKTGFGKKL